MKLQHIVKYLDGKITGFSKLGAFLYCGMILRLLCQDIWRMISQVIVQICLHSIYKKLERKRTSISQ